MQGVGQRFAVSRWTVWEGGAENKPDLAFVPPMLRRRLSRLSALALSVADGCLEGNSNVPVIFASQHGELERSARLLADIAHRQPLSPTAFSLSVHNSAPGLLALTRSDRAAATAIAAGDATLAMGLVEAVCQASESGGEVLLVHAETSLRPPYDELLSPVAEQAFAMRVTLEGDANYTLEPAAEDDEAASNDPAAQAAALAAILGGARDTIRLGNGAGTWRVRRHA